LLKIEYILKWNGVKSAKISLSSLHLLLQNQWKYPAPAPELPNPYGDRTVKRPLNKTQMFEVNVVAKCMY